MWAARSREESSDRGSGPLYSSKISNHLCKPPKKNFFFCFQNFQSFGVSRAAVGIFFRIFWSEFCVFRVPEPTRIYNQHDLMSAVGLNCLIKRTVWMKPRQRSASNRSRAQLLSRATCHTRIGWYTATYVHRVRNRATDASATHAPRGRVLFAHVSRVGPTTS